MPTPAGRGPGQPWRPGKPVPAAVDPGLPSADIRIGYARCSHLSQELDSQLDALAKHGIDGDKAEIHVQELGRNRDVRFLCSTVHARCIRPSGRR